MALRVREVVLQELEDVEERLDALVLFDLLADELEVGGEGVSHEHFGVVEAHDQDVVRLLDELVLVGFKCLGVVPGVEVVDQLLPLDEGRAPEGERAADDVDVGLEVLWLLNEYC